jgi:hypothetical protein
VSRAPHRDSLPLGARSATPLRVSRTLVALAPLAGACLVACGPLRSSTLIVDAAAEVAAARAAQAEQHAPFEFTAADIYYHKALEEQSHADFDLAIRFAGKSRDCARVALSRAELRMRESLGATRPGAKADARCRPGPERERPILDAHEEPNAGGGRALPAPARRPDGEPADPPPLAPVKPASPQKGPVVKGRKPAAPEVEPEPPPGDAAPPEGDPAPEAETP